MIQSQDYWSLITHPRDRYNVNITISLHGVTQTNTIIKLLLPSLQNQLLPGWPYSLCNLSRTLLSVISLARSSNVFARGNPQYSRHALYSGMPWSLPRWIFIAARSKDTAWNVVNSLSVSSLLRFSVGRFRLAGLVMKPRSRGSTPPSSTRRHGEKNALPRDRSPWENKFSHLEKTYERGETRIRFGKSIRTLVILK